ncbi:MAG: phosphoenolpyruvate synthase [Cellvibrionaceae bacterium]
MKPTSSSNDQVSSQKGPSNGAAGRIAITLAEESETLEQVEKVAISSDDVLEDPASHRCVVVPHNPVVWLENLSMEDVALVGDKNAALGETVCHLKTLGVNVPNGFALTAQVYRDYLEYNDLEKPIVEALSGLSVTDPERISNVGANVRRWLKRGKFPDHYEKLIREACEHLPHSEGISLAVRPSVVHADLPDENYARYQDTRLNVRSVDEVIVAIKEVFASLYNDRILNGQAQYGDFDLSSVNLSVCIQQMLPSEGAVSGTLTTIDSDSGFREAVTIAASYGLGEAVLQQAVNPDEFTLYKPSLREEKPAVLKRKLGLKAEKQVCLSGEEAAGEEPVQTLSVSESDRKRFSLNDTALEELARLALIVEQHYGYPLDIEWSRPSQESGWYILQVRPAHIEQHLTQQQGFYLKEQGETLCQGTAIGQAIGNGTVRIVRDKPELESVLPGDVLVSDVTAPDWEPVMKRASAIVTNCGGRTGHAAVIAREWGIPAVVGCGNATEILQDGMAVTVSCAEGDTGVVYRGRVAYGKRNTTVECLPALPFRMLMNVGNPDKAFDFAQLPHEGIGLARMEFMVTRNVGIHPSALALYDELPSTLKKTVDARTAGYPSAADFYVAKLAEAISTLAAAFAPHPVIVRLSDFKSNEYNNLIGGSMFENGEENPTLGLRGVARYLSPNFKACFELECQAIRKVREEMGFNNIRLLVPYVRTTGEARQVTDLMASQGLERGVDDLQIYMMCELPANAILANDFLQYFDGFSIGTNDLTQLTLGVDRNSGAVAHLFDEQNPAVKILIEQAINACKQSGKYVGVCGQAPSDCKAFAQWLMEQEVDSISLNPDSILETWSELGTNLNISELS